MESNIKRKNLRATKGKKKWSRNIDVTEVLHEMTDRDTAEHHKKIIQKKMGSKPLFAIDTMGDSKIKKTLEKDRFRKKPSTIKSQKELK